MNMKYFLEDSLNLNTKPDSNGAYIISLSNGKTITVQANVIHNGTEWDWKVDDQVFSNEVYALKYLQRLITEKLTGVRIIFHAKGTVPVICGVEGRACRAPGECNRALCSYCPVAEAFFAERDGVRLVYAV